MCETERIVAEISNPSDAYTIAGTLAGIRAATLALGHGNMGLDTEDRVNILPIFLLGGYEEWVEANGFDLHLTLSDRRQEVIAALRSVLIGGFAARREVESAISKMSPSDAEAWLAERHEAHRSSLNDIGRRAHDLANRMEETCPTSTPA